MIQVLLADDHGVVRDALRYLLEAQGDIQIVATAANGREAITKAMQHCPDVVVMDVSMPQMDGMQATQEILRNCSKTRVVMLTIYNTREHVRHAKETGASGYVLKESAGQELVAAVRALYQGRQYFSQKIDDDDADD